jgi:hypothetical protein
LGERNLKKVVNFERIRKKEEKGKRKDSMKKGENSRKRTGKQ